MNKKSIISIIIVLLIIVVAIISVTLYETFAIDVPPSNTYNISLNNSNESIVIPANSSKTVIYHITNTNKGKVKYGVTYTGNNISVKVYNNSEAKETDIIDYGENKFIKLHISNNGSTESTVTLKTILGYENGGDLIVSSGYTLVEEKYLTIAQYITSLYTNASKTPVTNNSVEYNYATSESLMNDRLGGTTDDYDAGNIRYYGASPNNYVYFNCDDYTNQTPNTCELWRIIGVFDGKVKIIRNSPIGDYAWDNKDTTTGAESDSGKNDWTTARAMKLLNPSDYYIADLNDNNLGQSLYYNAKSGTCYSGSRNATVDCDFTTTGLKNDATRNAIAEVIWPIGSHSTASVYSNAMYGYERGKTVYEGRPTVWSGKIALAYPSDYGYAADFSSCKKTLYDYNDTRCADVDWMKNVLNSSFNWFLTTRNTNTNDIWYAYDTGVIYQGKSAKYDYGIVPTLYLNENIGMERGTGLQKDPYKLIIN